MAWRRELRRVGCSITRAHSGLLGNAPVSHATIPDCQAHVACVLEDSRGIPAVHHRAQGRSFSTMSIPDLAYEEVVALPADAGVGGGPHQAGHDAPLRTAVVLHGLLGSGRNWRTWTRRLAASLVEAEAEQPGLRRTQSIHEGGKGKEYGGWRFVLVDLRKHGASASLAGLPKPSTIRNAAADVLRLIAHSPWSLPLPSPDSSAHRDASWQGVDLVLGHSVGGKVALECAKLAAEMHGHAAGSTGAAPGPQAGRPSEAALKFVGLPEPVKLPQQVWVLDSVPGSLQQRASPALGQGSAGDVAPAAADDEGDDVSRVLHMLLSLPRPVESRRWLVQEVQRRGFAQGLAEWLGSSLKTVDVVEAGTSKAMMDFQFDLPGAIELYHSYRATDLLPFVRDPPQGPKPGEPLMTLHFVRAANSDRWTPSTLQSLEACAAAHPQAVKIHVLPNAGHWLHVDNPQGLQDLVRPVILQGLR